MWTFIWVIRLILTLQNRAHKSHWNTTFGWTTCLCWYNAFLFLHKVGHSSHFRGFFIATIFSSCRSWDFWWILKFCWESVAKSHRWHLNGFGRFLSWVFWWVFKTCFWLNFLPQISHSMLFAFSWISFLCWIRLLA